MCEEEGSAACQSAGEQFAGDEFEVVLANIVVS
jgi:hypothetical protein